MAPKPAQIPDAKWRVIDAIASDLAVKNTRRMWRQRGVPHRYRITILKRAARKRVNLTARDLQP